MARRGDVLVAVRAARHDDAAFLALVVVVEREEVANVLVVDLEE